MFSRVAHHARSVVPHGAVVPLPRATALAAASRLPHGSLSASSSSSLVPRAAAGASVSRQLSSGALQAGTSRDWPAEGDAWDGQAAVTPAGLAARQAMLHLPASQAELQEAQNDHFCRTGIGVKPEQSELTTRIGMLMSIERPLRVLLEGFGPGVAQGLQALQLGPGDVVAEHAPNFPSLAVRLALDGVTAYLTVPWPHRLREVRDELARYSQGQPLAMRTLSKDLKPMRPNEYYPAAARRAASHLTALPGTGFESLPEGVKCKALISRRAFDYLDFHAADATVREAGRRLLPGGGLVFEFSHTAGRPVPASAGVRMNRVGFRDLEDAAQEAGLSLRHLHVAFLQPGTQGAEAIPARRVLQDADGRIDLRKADAAAWSGWDEICQRIDLRNMPVSVEVSGLFVKEGKAEKATG